MRKCSSTICLLEMRWDDDEDLIVIGQFGNDGGTDVQDVVDVGVTDVQGVVGVDVTDVQDDGDNDDETAPHCWLLQLL